VAQYTTQLLLPRIAKCIDDIVYENYTMPASQRAVIRSGNSASVLGTDGLYRFADEVNSKPSDDNNYDATAFMLKDVLNHEDLKRLEKINGMFELYLREGKMRLGQLRNVLTAAQYIENTDAIKTQEHNAEILYGAGMPTALKQYNILLRKGDFMTGRFEAMPMAGMPKYKYGAASRVEDQAVSLYEDALGRLEEIFTEVSGAELNQLHTWMDRSIEFGQASGLETDAHGMPRVRGSTSSYALNAGLPKLSKRLKRDECALKVLLKVAANIAFEFTEPQLQPEIIAAQSLKLKLLTAKLRNVNS